MFAIAPTPSLVAKVRKLAVGDSFGSQALQKGATLVLAWKRCNEIPINWVKRPCAEGDRCGFRIKRINQLEDAHCVRDAGGFAGDPGLGIRIHKYSSSLAFWFPIVHGSAADRSPRSGRCLHYQSEIVCSPRNHFH